MDRFKLSDTYLLKGATLGDIDAVQVVSELREFQDGEVIVSIDDPRRDIMIITEGRVRVETKSGDLVEEVRKGAMLGEIAFIDGKPRSAQVVSSGICQVLVIPEDRLRELMKESPSLEATIFRNVAKALCERLRDANLQVESLMAVR